ncbi:glycoside hydrolase superfamily [Mycena galopus ATCC 62051]|nr:glycoside hydrolase superfamily [Mycena galopus ATCC 62051]
MPPTHTQSVDVPYLAANSNAFLAPNAYIDDSLSYRPSSPNNSGLPLSSPAPGPRRSTKGRGRYIALGLAAILVVAAVSTNGTSSGLGGTSTDEEVLTGGDRSVMVMENGYADALTGLGVALNESWTWGQDRAYGVNLGVITPALFQAYPSAPDEWTLATLMRADGTLEATMEAHYDTFITEQDIAQIAGAGLNWVRVPIPFWAIRCVALLLL